MTLRLTVDTDAWRGPRRPRRRGTARAWCRSSRATATGSGGPSWRAIAAGFADTIAVGTVHELDHVPAGVTPVVLTPTLAAAGRRRRRSSPSARSPTSAPSPAGAGGCSSSWRRRCAASARPSTSSARSRRPPARAGLDIVGFSIHPPLAGTDDEHLDDIAAWLDVLDPTTRCGSATCRPAAYHDLRDAWPERRFRIRLGTALWHGDKAALHLDADVLDVRPRAGRRARRLPPARRARSTAALVMIGAGTAHGVHPLDDGRSPFHFARRRLALLEPPHMHTSMVFVPAGEPAPGDRRRRRRAAAADLHRPSTRSDGGDAPPTPRRRATVEPRPAARARRRARRRPDRRRRDELPRLPDPARRRARATVPSTGFFDPWTGPLSTRFAATFVLVAGVGVTLLTDASAPPATAARQRHGGGRSSAAAWRSTAVGCVLDFDLAGHDPAVLRRDVRRRRRAVHAAQPVGRGHRRRRRARRRRRSRWWGLERRLDGRDTTWLFAPGRALAARRCCSTCSSTAPTRCCRGWRSSAPASCSAGVLRDRRGGGRRRIGGGLDAVRRWRR